MSLALIALLLAGGGAGWLLWRLASGGAGRKGVPLLKLIIWFGLIATLAAIKLWPLAFMVLLAAGAVTAIELWRDNAVARENAQARPPAPTGAKPMTLEEAEALLGLGAAYSAEEARAAHKRLIAQTHPDKGGTDYLAAKINEARDIVLRTLDAEHDP